MLGATVPTIGGLHNAFNFADLWGCECIQIYTTQSRRWATPPLTAEQKDLYFTAWGKSNVKEVISHVPFLVNLASPDDELRQKSLERFKIEIQSAEELNVNLLVLHPGSPKGASKDDAIKRVAEAINIAIADTKKHTGLSAIASTGENQKPTVCSRCKILLETMSGQGTVLGSTFEELAAMIALIERDELVGVCFDMAHVYAAGYDVSGDGILNVFEKFDSIVGLERIGVFHINDSMSRFNSHHDRHACVGSGTIGTDAFHYLLTDERFMNIPKVLELPGRGDLIKDNLAFLRAMIQVS